MAEANPQSHDLGPQMSTFQSKSTHHTQNQEDLTMNEKKKRKSTDVNTEMTEILGLSGKDFKAATLKMLQ